MCTYTSHVLGSVLRQVNTGAPALSKFYAGQVQVNTGYLARTLAHIASTGRMSSTNMLQYEAQKQKLLQVVVCLIILRNLFQVSNRVRECRALHTTNTFSRT